jgi:HSP20 family molecular chaperone IbpA
MYHALEDLMSDAFVVGAFSETGGEKKIAPNYHSLYVNGYEVLEIELPGVKKESLTMELKEHILTVTGSRAPYAPAVNTATAEAGEIANAKKSDGVTVRKSAEEGPKSLMYSVKFKMSRVANVDDIKGDFNDGLLRVVIPRRKEIEPRRIQINS